MCLDLVFTTVLDIYIYIYIYATQVKLVYDITDTDCSTHRMAMFFSGHTKW